MRRVALTLLALFISLSLPTFAIAQNADAGPPPPPPLPTVAEFEGIPTTGDAPLAVDFTDLSFGDLTSWSWDFGDGGTSSAQSPSHQYTTAGTYTVSLIVTGLGGSDSEVKTDYIIVTDPSGPTMHVESIEITISRKGKNWSATARVMIVDGSGAPLSRATVIGNWSGAINKTGVSGTTRRKGVAKINSGKFRNSGDLTFAVTGVVKSGYTYELLENVEASDTVLVP